MRKAIQFEDILTLEEMAEKIGLTLDTVNGWRKKGMPVIKIDKYVRFWWPKVLEWIVKQEEKSEPDPRQMSFLGKNGKS